MSYYFSLLSFTFLALATEGKEDQNEDRLESTYPQITKAVEKAVKAGQFATIIRLCLRAGDEERIRAWLTGLGYKVEIEPRYFSFDPVAFTIRW